MVKLLLASICFLSQTLVAEEFKAPKIWAQEISDKLAKNPLKVIRNIVIFDSDPVKQKAWDHVMTDFSSLGFIQYIDHENIKFLRQINHEKLAGVKNSELVSTYMPAQLLLEEGPTGVQVSASGPKGFAPLATWELTTGDRESSATLLEWMHKMLGYEAVVLDVNGKFVLGALIQSNRNTGQGILVRDSSEKYSLAAMKVNGEALLNLRKAEGSLAVFEVLVNKTQGGIIRPGSKILMGKR